MGGLFLVRQNKSMKGPCSTNLSNRTEPRELSQVVLFQDNTLGVGHLHPSSACSSHPPERTLSPAGAAVTRRAGLWALRWLRSSGVVEPMPTRVQRAEASDSKPFSMLHQQRVPQSAALPHATPEKGEKPPHTPPRSKFSWTARHSAL